MPIIEHSPINERHDFYLFIINCININEVAQT